MKGRVWRDTRTRGKPVWKLIYEGLEGKTHWESTQATNRTEAKALLERKESELARMRAAGIKEDPTFEDFVVGEYLPHCKAMHSKTSYEESDLSRANMLIPVFGEQRLRTIDKAAIKRYVADLKNGVCEATGRKYQNASINKNLAFLSAVFREAMERGYVEKNPCKGVKRLRTDNRLRYLTVTEADDLLKACAEHLRPIVVAALDTGGRKQEILGLKWGDIDLEQRLVRFRPGKTGKQRYIPMTERLYTLLDAMKPDDTSWGKELLLFTRPGANGKPVRYGNVRTAFMGACGRAGIEDFHFHDLRHTYASWLVQRGASLNTVRELLGHGSMAMTLRYAHLAPDNLKAAVSLLDSGKSVALALQEGGRSLTKPLSGEALTG